MQLKFDQNYKVITKCPFFLHPSLTVVLCVWCLFLRVAFRQDWTRSEGRATMGWSRGFTGNATASTPPIADPSTSMDGRYPFKPKSLTVRDQWCGSGCRGFQVVSLHCCWCVVFYRVFMAVCGVASSVTTLTIVDSCFIASGTELVALLIWNVMQRQRTYMQV